MWVTILLTTFCLKIHALKDSSQGCEDFIKVEPMKRFHCGDFSGTWYEIKRYENSLERDTVCGKTKFQAAKNQTELKITHTQWNLKDDKEEVLFHYAKPVIENSGAFALGSKDIRSSHLNFLILYTDYTNVALVWLCQELEEVGGGRSKQGLWIYSRKKWIAPKVLHALEMLANENGLMSQKLIDVNQFDAKCSSSRKNLFNYLTLVPLACIIFYKFT